MIKKYKFVILSVIFLVAGSLLLISNLYKGNTNNSNVAFVTWIFNMKTDKWESSGPPPNCPALVFKTPIDISKVTSILYPGQFRGDGYDPHGGFRYDNPKINNLKITSPISGYVNDGNRRIVQNGATQYLFDIINSCGIMMRIDHITKLSPEFQKLANKLPKPLEGNYSKTTVLRPYTLVKKGDWVGTQIKTDVNYGLDWGVYDLRKENDASKNPAYRKKHGQYAWETFYALCWLNYLSPKEQSIAKSLPAGDEVAGKKSDYCH